MASPSTAKNVPTAEMDQPTSGPRVLLIRPSALGDVCRSVHIPATLAASVPGVRLDWLVQQGFEAAVAAHPAVDRVIPFDRRGMGRDLKRLKLGSTARLVRELRCASYDVVIDAQGLARSGLLTFVSGAAVRIGFDNAQEGAPLAYTLRVGAPRDEHAVDRMARLVRAAVRALGVDEIVEPSNRLCLRAPMTNGDAEVEADLVGERPVVIAPTSRWAGKRWPIDRFADLARALLADGVRKLVVVGGPGEEHQCRPLTQLATNDPRVIDLVGRSSVDGLMRTIAASRLVIANDSAALHMAVGFDVPTVALFGPTIIDRVGPYGRSHEVLQHLDGHRLDAGDHKDTELGIRFMRRIDTASVIAAARKKLSECPSLDGSLRSLAHT